VALIDALWSAPPPGTCASVATQVGVSGRTLYRRFGRFAPLLSRIGLLCVLLRSAETGRHSIRAAANSCGIATSTVRRRTATILSCTPSEVTPAVCLELLAGTALSVARLVGSD
jgi:hypothetical protein